jgi:uncharacterized protein (DUF779 family)
MRVDATDQARAVIRRMGTTRGGRLTVTIGTGCCESTAPFLYEDFWPGPDQAEVGEVAGVTVYAPAYLRDLYPGDDGVVIDVVEVDAESLSIETELGVRLVLRGLGVDAGACSVPPPRSVASFDPTDPERPGAVVRGELPEPLRSLGRIR